MRSRLALPIVTVGLLCAAHCACAEMLSFSFQDPAGDQTRATGADLSRIDVAFDNATGQYTVTLFAVASNSFSGRLKVNANFVNPDTESFTMSPSYFFDNLRFIEASEPASSVSFSGVNGNLLHWRAGHRVATSSEPFGIASDAPPSAFSSYLEHSLDFPWVSTDDFPPLAVSLIRSIPEPTTLALCALGLVFGSLMAPIRRARRRRQQV